MKTSRVLFSLLIMSVLGLALYAEPESDILAKIDDQVNFMNIDTQGLYTFAQESNGQVTDQKISWVFRRDSVSSWFIIMVEPVAQKGKAYLKSYDNMWVYDPVSKRTTFTNPDSKFQNMNVRNSDFSRSNLAKR